MVPDMDCLFITPKFYFSVRISLKIANIFKTYELIIQSKINLKSANNILKIFLRLSLCDFDIFNRKFAELLQS